MLISRLRDGSHADNSVQMTVVFNQRKSGIDRMESKLDGKCIFSRPVFIHDALDDFSVMGSDVDNFKADVVQVRLEIIGSAPFAAASELDIIFISYIHGYI